MASIVFLLWVITINCDVNDISLSIILNRAPFPSSRGASTSSSKQKGEGFSLNKENNNEIATIAFSPPDNNESAAFSFPEDEHKYELQYVRDHWDNILQQIDHQIQNTTDVRQRELLFRHMRMYQINVPITSGFMANCKSPALLILGCVLNRELLLTLLTPKAANDWADSLLGLIEIDLTKLVAL